MYHLENPYLHCETCNSSSLYQTQNNLLLHDQNQRIKSGVNTLDRMQRETDDLVDKYQNIKPKLTSLHEQNQYHKLNNPHNIHRQTHKRIGMYPHQNQNSSTIYYSNQDFTQQNNITNPTNFGFTQNQSLMNGTQYYDKNIYQGQGQNQGLNQMINLQKKNRTHQNVYNNTNNSFYQTQHNLW